MTCEIGVQTDGYGRVGDSGRGTNAQVPDCPSSHYSIQHGLHRCGTSLVHKKLSRTKIRRESILT